jgi:hypothetical protein
MAATVEALHPGQAAAATPPAPAGQVLSALEQMASSLIGEQLGAMFDSADDVLFEMAEKARKGDEKQNFLSTMRTVRLERPRILDAFQRALRDALRRTDATATPAEVDLDDLEKWTLQESSDLEEKIAVSNMDQKAASMHAKELLELEQRLTRLADDSHGAVSAKALCPARILDAFRQSMKGLDVDLPIKLVIYKLFDRVVVTNLGNVFAGANRMLESRGIQPKTAARIAPKNSNAPLWKPATPPAPTAMFQEMAGGLRSQDFTAALRPYLAGAGGATDAGAGGAAQPSSGAVAVAQQNAQLADEMLAVLEAAGHGRPVSSWMPTQNLALVSRMFDDFYADPELPETARPVLGRLQFPVMKFAMSDPSFFADPKHPVRELVHDVYDNLTHAHAAPGADFHRLEELIQDLLQRFEPDPAKLRQDARGVHAVTEVEAERFLEQQRERLEEQRKALQEKIRRIVAQELRLHIGDRRLPRPVLPLVLSGFGPMLVAHYRAGGQDHQGWRGTLALLDRVLACLDAAAANAPDRAAAETAVIADVAQCLAAAAYPAARIEQLADPLGMVFEELAAGAALAAPAPRPERAAEKPAAAAPAPVVVAAAPLPAPAKPAAAAVEQERTLQLLLRGGDWFRVWCAASNNCRWLKLERYYAGADTVVFEDFGGENRLKMRAAAFVHDLVAGRSAPVDPDPAITRLIQQLPPAPVERLDARAAWFKAEAAAAAA